PSARYVPSLHDARPISEVTDGNKSFANLNSSSPNGDKTFINSRKFPRHCTVGSFCMVLDISCAVPFTSFKTLDKFLPSRLAASYPAATKSNACCVVILYLSVSSITSSKTPAASFPYSSDPQLIFSSKFSNCVY